MTTSNWVYLIVIGMALVVIAAKIVGGISL